MSTKSKYLLALAAFPCLAFADAGPFFEPLVTYEKLDTKVNYPAPFNDSKGESDGYGIGARIGVHLYESLFLGLDGRYAQTEYNANSGDYVADTNQYNYGPVLGVQLPTPISLRVWGGYIVDGEFDPGRANDTDLRFEDASGYRVGAGLGIAMLSLNLEYQKIKYDKAILESAGPFDPNERFDDVSMDADGYLLSISFPVSL